jgi:hypothetical protein
MEMEATAGSCPAPMPSVSSRVGALLGAIALRAVLVMVLLAAWLVRQGGLYTPASDLGYWLGVVGGSLMLVLLIYPLRKRMLSLAVLGPLKHWFRFHLFAGIAGPLIVLFHSTFRVGSFNAAIALGSMLLVVASGLVGRYIYRKIHHGLYGSRATATELQRALAQQMEALQPLLGRLPAVEREIACFSALASYEPAGRWRRAMHFAALGGRRYLAGRRQRRALKRYDERFGGEAATNDALRGLAATINDTLKAVQRSAQFSTYEKLFSLWHVVHIPFLCLLVITAIVHVVAVHAY